MSTNIYTHQFTILKFKRSIQLGKGVLLQVFRPSLANFEVKPNLTITFLEKHNPTIHEIFACLKFSVFNELYAVHYFRE